MRLIVIRDYTLREGMELPNMDISLGKKLKIGRILESMNVPKDRDRHVIRNYRLPSFIQFNHMKHCNEKIR